MSPISSDVHVCMYSSILGTGGDNNLPQLHEFSTVVITVITQSTDVVHARNLLFDVRDTLMPGSRFLS